jgi:phosphotriesterase-related protein
MRALITTLGPFARSEVGMILPHEHIFVDLGPIEEANYLAAEPGPVIDLMAPELDRARAFGVTALVECTPLGVGRRADIVRAVSEAAAFPIVVPTGIYREPRIPRWAHKASQGEIRDWMVDELTGQIEDSGVQAGWIKLSASDDGLKATETKIIQAAALAGKETGAVIGSHTIRGRVVLDQLEIIEERGYALDRFIWIHTQIEPDLDLHLEVARRGAWIEYDGIGSDDDAFYTERILRVLEAGLGHRLLISHDRGWYDPSQPGGGDPQPFTYLSEVFLPKLRALGIGEDTIHQLSSINPFDAFAR